MHRDLQIYDVRSCWCFMMQNYEELNQDHQRISTYYYKKRIPERLLWSWQFNNSIITCHIVSIKTNTFYFFFCQIISWIERIWWNNVLSSLINFVLSFQNKLINKEFSSRNVTFQHITIYPNICSFFLHWITKNHFIRKNIEIWGNYSSFLKN